MVKSLNDPQLVAAVGMQDYPKIIQYLSAYLKEEPQNLLALQQLGNAYYQLKDYDNALSYYQQYADCEQTATIYYQLGMTYFKKGNFEQASHYFLKAIAVDPNFHEAQIGMGWIYCESEDFLQALSYFEQLFYKGHKTSAVIERLAKCYYELGQFTQAEFFYRWLCEIEAHKPGNHACLGNILLLQQKYEEGWFHYRWLFKTPAFTLQALKNLAWRGEDISNKTLLIYCDQGVGDVIQMIRFLPAVEKKAGKVILICREQLIKLVKKTVNPRTEIIVHNGAELPQDNELFSAYQIDYYCMLNAIPSILNTQINDIPQQSYLRLELSEIKNFPLEGSFSPSTLKVGIVWAGNPEFKKDSGRSTPLSLWKPLFSIKKTKFYSLQKGEPLKQLAAVDYNIIDLGTEIKDFNDTAAYIMQMDLIIAVDTSVVHVAGALGKPVWVLLPFVPDWRYGVAGEGMPWYKSMRVFRQPRLGAWPEVMKQVAKALRKKVNG